MLSEADLFLTSFFLSLPLCVQLTPAPASFACLHAARVLGSMCPALLLLSLAVLLQLQEELATSQLYSVCSKSGSCLRASWATEAFAVEPPRRKWQLLLSMSEGCGESGVMLGATSRSSSVLDATESTLSCIAAGSIERGLQCWN